MCSCIRQPLYSASCKLLFKFFTCNRCQAGCTAAQGPPANAQEPLVLRRTCLGFLAGLALASRSAAHAAIVDEDVASRVFEAACESLTYLYHQLSKHGESRTGTDLAFEPDMMCASSVPKH